MSTIAASTMKPMVTPRAIPVETPTLVSEWTSERTMAMLPSLIEGVTHRWGEASRAFFAHLAEVAKNK